MPTKNQIWLTDMRNCLPEENLSEVRRKGAWKYVSYELTNGRKGYLIYAVYQNKARPVQLPLRQKGEYDIHVGLWNYRGGNSVVRLKLSGDPCYCSFHGNGDSHCLTDCFLKRAHLDNQDLCIAKVNNGEPGIAALAYVRLEQVSAQKKKKEPAVKYPLLGTNDGESISSLRSKEELWEDIECYRDTDFKKIFYSIGGTDLTSYPTRNCTVISSKTDDFASQHEYNFAESVREFKRQKLNPLKCRSDYARKIGLDFHLYIRMQAWALDPPWEEFFNSDFFWNNPQWRCVAQDGRKTNQMSYAFPEVRKHVLDVLNESFAISGANGVDLTFMRGSPCVLYESPVLEVFKKKTGLDARKIKIDDQRFLKFKAEYVTGFIRETRVLLDKISGAGKRKEISVSVYGDCRSNLMSGLDVETWADQKLVDSIVVWPQSADLQYICFEPAMGKKEGYLAQANYRFFRQLCSRNKIPFYLCILVVVAQNHGELISLVQDAYRNGVDGLYFWDAPSEFNRSNTNEILRRMGDKDWVMSLNPQKFIKQRTFPLKELGGFMMDKYWSWTGF